MARWTTTTAKESAEMEIKFHGHSCFELSEGETTVLVDPFLKPNNPAAVASAEEVEPTVVVISHGHVDHIADAVGVATRTGAECVAIVEVANWLEEQGVEKVHDPNLGGTVQFDWGWVKMVPAWHTAVSPSGTPHTPAGLLVYYDGKLVYHLGDTCLFSDLKLISHRGNRVDVALIPIGGHFTMDRYDAVTAAEYVGADTVIPIHYGTFPPVETDAQAYKSDVQNAGFSEVVLLEPGDTHTIR